MRWQGRQDHTLTLPVPKSAWEVRQTAPHVVQAIDDLLDHDTHAKIAVILAALSCAPTPTPGTDAPARWCSASASGGPIATSASRSGDG
jgi:hypothetical protein